MGIFGKKWFKKESEKTGVAQAMQARFDSIMSTYRKTIESSLEYLDESDAITIKQLETEVTEYAKLQHEICKMTEDNHQMLMALCEKML